MNAMEFAIKAHGKQLRKYTGEPYWKHLAEVAGILTMVPAHHDRRSLVLEIAWLHDYIEDCDLHLSVRDRYEKLAKHFGHVVASGVMELSDVEQPGNRAARKRQTAERIAAAPWYVQNVKLADTISNTSSIVKHDPKFAAVYLEEKRYLLAKILETKRPYGFDQGLFDLASRIVNGVDE